MKKDFERIDELWKEVNYIEQTMSLLKEHIDTIQTTTDEVLKLNRNLLDQNKRLIIYLEKK